MYVHIFMALGYIATKPTMTEQVLYSNTIISTELAYQC